MTNFESITKNEDGLIELLFDLNDEMPQPLCDYCIWDKLKTPSGKPTKEVKQNCPIYCKEFWQRDDCRPLCAKGIKKWLRSEAD